MRKILFIAAAMLAFASCSSDDNLNMYTREFYIQSDHWQFDDVRDARYYYTFEFPELRQRICDLGDVSAYIFVNNTTQGKLPYVRSYRSADGEEMWVETIYYEYSPGKITFFVEFSDFGYDPDNLAEPGNKDFRVVLTW